MNITREEFTSVVRGFIDQIKAGHSEGLMAHQTEDFTFLDYDVMI